VVKSDFVNNPATKGPGAPIGVLAALATGFDRIAARPILLLPPFVLDLFLWLGPPLRISTLAAAAALSLALPAGADPTMTSQLASFRQALTDLGSRFNLLSALSSLPVGVPSLMASRMPAVNPLGKISGTEVPGYLAIAATWLVLTLMGLGLGAVYHIWAARQVAPRTELATVPMAWGRLAVLSLIGYVAGFVLVGAILVVASLVASVVPWLGLVLGFLGFSLVFWLVVYLMFSPHGIIRYRFGVIRSIMESVQVVRWNLVSTAFYLALTFGVTWLSTWVWSLPSDGSWYTLLAVVGHAFVSAVLLVASYAFYQGRREWTQKIRELVAARQASQQGPPQASV
jgi:hypothetical protein